MRIYKGGLTSVCHIKLSVRKYNNLTTKIIHKIKMIPLLPIIVAILFAATNSGMSRSYPSGLRMPLQYNIDLIRLPI